FLRYLRKFAVSEPIQNLHLSGRDPMQTRDASPERHDLFKHGVAARTHRENIVLELVDRCIEFVYHRQIKIDDLIQYLMKQIRRAACAGKRIRSNIFFDVSYTLKFFDVICDDKILSEKTV